MLYVVEKFIADHDDGMKVKSMIFRISIGIIFSSAYRFSSIYRSLQSYMELL